MLCQQHYQQQQPGAQGAPLPAKESSAETEMDGLFTSTADLLSLFAVHISARTVSSSTFKDQWVLPKRAVIPNEFQHGFQVLPVILMGRVNKEKFVSRVSLLYKAAQFNTVYTVYITYINQPNQCLM